MTTYARVIADSITKEGDRLTTVEARMHPRAVEHLLTHRALSRGGASRRAIPLEKQLAAVALDPCYPVRFGTEQPGMQSGPPLEGEELEEAKSRWEVARDHAMSDAQDLGAMGIHKEVASAPVHPYEWRTYIISATNWQGFFDQRLSPLAQAEIRAVATEIYDAMWASTPERIINGDWHLPYITNEDREYAAFKMPGRVLGTSAFPVLIKVSAARCARVSYLTHDGVRDFEQDLNLYDKLVSARPGHWSPLEHVATPMKSNAQVVDVGRRGKPRILTLPRYGNFLGWHQHRFDVEE